MPPPGMQCSPIWQPGLEAGPEAEERAEREREEHAIAGADARAAIDGLPAVEHPLPALVGVDPAQRPSGRGRGLAVARVALDRLGERRAPRADSRPDRRSAPPSSSAAAFEVARKLQAFERQSRRHRACACRTRCARRSRRRSSRQPPSLHRRQRVPIESFGRSSSTTTRLPRPRIWRRSPAESARPSSTCPAAARRRRSSPIRWRSIRPSRVIAQAYCMLRFEMLTMRTLDVELVLEAQRPVVLEAGGHARKADAQLRAARC